MISRFRKKENSHVGLLDYYTLLYVAGITGESGEHFPHRNGPTLHRELCTHPEDYKTVLNRSPQQDSHSFTTRAEFEVEDSGNNLFQLCISPTLDTGDTSGHAV
jgi:hypothetical protein